MKRILHVIGSLGVGGSQTLIMNIYRKIDRTKIQFDFIVDHPEQLFFAKEIRKLGGKVYVMPAFRGWNIVEVVKAWSIFFQEHEEYKILHSHVRSYASIYFQVAKKYGVKTIIHSHSTSNGKGVKAVVKKILQYPLRFQADYFMACSIEAGKWLFGKRIVKQDNFWIVKNAVDAEQYRYDSKKRKIKRKNFDITDDTFLLGYLGRVTKSKNPVFVIDVFKQLVSIFESEHKYKDIKLLLVGDGDLLLDIKKYAIALGVEEKIIFTGARSDVADLLLAMDFYIFPSLWEGLGITLVEAQASGLRCICSERIPKEAIVTDLVEAYSLSRGAAAWAHFISSNSKYERCDRVYEIKQSGYDVESNARLIQEFYLERIK